MKQTSFIKLNNATFQKKIVPGEQLVIRAKLDTFKRGLAIGSASGFVDGSLAVSADFVIALPDVLAKFNPSSGLDQK